jgi:MFS family permease
MANFFFSRALRVLLMTNGVILFSSAMMGPIYALFVEKIGGDLLDASLTGGIFALAAGITSFISGRYADKIKENELIIVLGYSLIAFGYFLYLFVDTIWFLFLIQVIIGFGEAIYSPAFDSVYSKHIDHHKSGLQWGSWETINYFSVAFGAVIGGLLVQQFGFQFIFVIMMLLCSFSALYIYFLPRKLL